MFIYSITHTRVANTLVMLSLAPLMAAVLSGIFLREHVPSRTWLAIGGAVVGVVIIFSGDLGTGGASGNWAGVGVAASIGGVLVVLRRNPTLNLIPAMALGSAIAGVIGAPLATPRTARVEDVFLVLGLGLVVMPIAFGLISIAPRYIPAPEVGLFLPISTVFGPTWVWLAVGEMPGWTTAIGGGIVVGALVAHSVATLREAKLGREMPPVTTA